MPKVLTLLLLCLVAATPVQVFRTDSTSVVGEASDFNEAGVRVDGEVIPWLDQTPTGAFTVRMRLIDKTSAADWLALGDFGWGHGVERQARMALARAVKLDPALAGSAGAVTGQELGHLRATPEPEPDDEPTVEADADEEVPPAPVGGHFRALSGQELRQAMNDVRQIGQTVGREAGVKFTEIETPRCLIFTDWHPRDHGFLTFNVNSAYDELHRLFALAPGETPFYGKLPVLMFEERTDYIEAFNALAPGAMAENTAGVHMATSRGLGLLMMWQPPVPRNSDGSMQPQALKEAQDRWAAVLAHEFTHSFLHRYRGTASIPNWLNEGLAEWVEHELFPREAYRRRALQRSRQVPDLGDGFFEARNIEGPDYAVAHTMVEMLIEQDLLAFRELIHDVKGGDDIDAALMRRFNVDRQGLEAAWRERMDALPF